MPSPHGAKRKRHPVIHPDFSRCQLSSQSPNDGEQLKQTYFYTVRVKRRLVSCTLSAVVGSCCLSFQPRGALVWLEAMNKYIHQSYLFYHKHYFNYCHRRFFLSIHLTPSKPAMWTLKLDRHDLCYNCMSHWDFSHGKIRSLSSGKASWDTITLPNLPNSTKSNTDYRILLFDHKHDYYYYCH